MKKCFKSILLMVMLVFLVSAIIGCSSDNNDDGSSSPTITPSPVASPIPPTTKNVIAYFPNYGIYARGYLITDIPANKITHINYAFFGIDTDTGKIKLTDPWADVQKVFTGDEDKGFPDQTWDQSERGEAGCLGRLKQLKDVYPHIVTFMSIGGWDSDKDFSQIATTKTAREKFVASCVEFMVKYDFNGIDVDWEFPGASNKENCTLLMQEFRKQLDIQGSKDGKYYMLTMAGPVGYDLLLNLELDKLAEVLDYFNVMSYDYHGSWNTVTNHNAPLYMNPNDPSDPTSRQRLNVDWTITYCIDSGIPVEKINMGFPIYGRAWEEVSSTDDGLFQDSSTYPDTGQAGNWGKGTLDYWKIHELMTTTSNYTRHWDDNAKVPWLYGKNLTPNLETGGMFVSYDDAESTKEKLKYMKEKGLAGTMLWELTGDIRNSDDPDSIVNVIYQELKR